MYIEADFDGEHWSCPLAVRVHGDMVRSYSSKMVYQHFDIIELLHDHNSINSVDYPLN